MKPEDQLKAFLADIKIANKSFNRPRSSLKALLDALDAQVAAKKYAEIDWSTQLDAKDKRIKKYKNALDSLAAVWPGTDDYKTKPAAPKGSLKKAQDLVKLYAKGAKGDDEVVSALYLGASKLAKMDEDYKKGPGPWAEATLTSCSGTAGAVADYVGYVGYGQRQDLPKHTLAKLSAMLNFAEDSLHYLRMAAGASHDFIILKLGDKYTLLESDANPGKGKEISLLTKYHKNKDQGQSATALDSAALMTRVAAVSKRTGGKIAFVESGDLE